MADNTEASSDAQVTFKVKTSGDHTHTITMAESATVLDLKNKLATEAYENIAVERQRLIYSGRVLKNDDTLGSYKIKPNNTIHMVKSAASNPTPQPVNAASSTPTSTGVPTNMAAGTANNPLANLTGARYAGHGINMPGMDMFGPDGGMSGPMMDEDSISRMMENPNVQQQMNEALNNPDFINMMIESNPMLRNVPNAREILQSPFMRQMMTNPEMMRSAMRMQRTMQPGGNSAFPAPGATDTTPSGSAATDGGNNANAQGGQGQPPNPFGGPSLADMMGGMGGQGGTGQGGQGMDALFNMMRAGQGAAATGQAPNQGAGATTEGTTAQGQGQGQGQGQEGAQQNPFAGNPFAALLGGGGGAGGAGAGGFGGLPPPNPEMMQQMLQMLGGGGGGAGAAPAPADNRPPEERYADQLRQLNDMGFFDFDRNVAALRRSGGSVQGAIEYLLTATD